MQTSVPVVTPVKTREDHIAWYVENFFDWIKAKRAGDTAAMEATSKMAADYARSNCGSNDAIDALHWSFDLKQDTLNACIADPRWTSLTSSNNTTNGENT